MLRELSCLEENLYEKEKALREFLIQGFKKLNLDFDVDFIIDQIKVDLSLEIFHEIESNMDFKQKIFYQSMVKNPKINEYVAYLRKLHNESCINFIEKDFEPDLENQVIEREENLYIFINFLDQVKKIK